LLFIVVNIFIKGFLLYIVWRKNTNTKDFFFGIALFIIYIIWLNLNGISYYEFLKDSYKAMKTNKIIKPAAYYLLHIKNYLER